MHIKNSKTNYGLISVLLHWIMAILIIGLFSLGHYMEDLEYYDRWYHIAPWWHKSFGITIMTLVLVRLTWKFTDTMPKPLASYKHWEIKAAKVVHGLFYILLLTICLSGYFIATAKGAAIEVFGWFHLPAITHLNETMADFAGKIHEASTLFLAILFIIHSSAALKHHFIDKDATLKRMLF